VILMWKSTSTVHYSYFDLAAILVETESLIRLPGAGVQKLPAESAPRSFAQRPTKLLKTSTG